MCQLSTKFFHIHPLLYVSHYHFPLHLQVIDSPMYYFHVDKLQYVYSSMLMRIREYRSILQDHEPLEMEMKSVANRKRNPSKVKYSIAHLECVIRSSIVVEYNECIVALTGSNHCLSIVQENIFSCLR